MKRSFFIISMMLALFLAACERPVPRGNVAAPDDETAPVPTIVIPTTVIEGAPETTAVPGDTPTPASDQSIPTQESQTAATPGPVTENPTPTDEANTQPLPADGVHIVQAGETLYQISIIYGVSINDIAVANNLTNVDTLEVGQSLTIPEPGSGDDTPVETEEQVYIVRAGDTLFRIGLAYGFTVEELAEYNGLTDINDLDVGQEIRIPPSSN